MPDSQSFPFTLEGNLLPSGTDGSASFGSAVALSSDGNTAAVGSDGDNGQGSVSIFTRDPVTKAWSQQGSKLTGSVSGSNPMFGYSVAISWDGDTVLVGAPLDAGAGSVFVFDRSGGVWQQSAKFTAPSGTSWFGRSVAIAWDGDVALVGAISGQCGGFVYNRVYTPWTTQPVRLAATPDTNDSGFGQSVALSADGDIAMVSSFAGAVVFTAVTPQQPWVDQTPWVWNQPGFQLPNPSDLPSGGSFGSAVSLSADGDVALIGGAGSSGANSGAWVYTSSNGVWSQSGPRFSPPSNSQLFGSYVSLSADGQAALVADFPPQVPGAAILFTNQNGAWAPLGTELMIPVNLAFNQYTGMSGLAMSADGHTVILGAFSSNIGDPQGAWVYDNDRKVVTHVFVLMLENHSFDNIFGLSNIPGIISTASGNSNTWIDPSKPGSDPITSSVLKGAAAVMPTDPAHEFTDAVEQLCGAGKTFTNGQPYPKPINNSGFASNYATSRTEINSSGNPKLPTADEVGEIMKCFDTPSQLPVIYELATEYALCDQWFSSLPGPTFPNRCFLHGCSSSGMVVNPNALWALPGLGFQFAHGSIFDALKRKGVFWNIYYDKQSSSLPPPVALLQGIQYPFDVSNFSTFATDVQNPNYPEGYTFIEPNYGDVHGESFKGGSSQHPMDGVYGGENLIKQTYEAIRSSPFWNSSLLIITYDEHGGFYDSVAPGTAIPPADGFVFGGPTQFPIQFQFDQYGVRVPAVIVSPLIPKGPKTAPTVDHTVYDHTSVAATLQQIFQMPPLTKRDAAAKNLMGLLSLSTPRADGDCPRTLPNAIPDPKPPISLAAVPRDLNLEPLPETGTAQSFLAASLKTDMELAHSDAERAAILARFKTIKTRGQAKAYAEEVGAKADRAMARRQR